MRIGIRNATFLCTALALAFFMSSVRAHAADPASAQLSSNSVRVGAAKIVIAGAAGIRNPDAPGAYRVKVAHGSETFAAPLAIH
jgi:hypothetical protein